MKNLVIYYSRKGENYVNGKIKNIDKGNTEYIAEFVNCSTINDRASCFIAFCLLFISLT